MSGNTGPQGPRGPVGPEGPSGITGQNGIEGIRGFPGRPIYPFSVQILRSGADSEATTLIDGLNTSTRRFEDATPSLDSGNSTTIVGFSNDPDTGYLTIPVGQYYIEASSTLNDTASNVGFRLMQSNAEEHTTAIIGAASGGPYGSIYLEGPLIVLAGNTGPYYFANITGISVEGNLAPTYAGSNYGATGPTITPPNISVAIMKLV